MTIDLTWAGWFTGVVVLYYAVLFVVSLRRPRADTAPAGWEAPLMIVVVPARNEDKVIGETIANLRGMEYAGECRILVVDDASTDTTAAVIAAHVSQDPRVRLLSRTAEQGGRGKSDVLNHAYRLIRDAAADGDPWLAGRAPADIVYAIVDADGRLEKDSLTVVAPYFIDPSVGSTQVGVRIYNAGDSTLARMQDMEFVGFTYLVQIARDKIGSSGLGGNGQFTRLSALISLGDAPWKTSALTEDLDLGLRLIEAGWRTRFCHHTTVAQQGLTRWKPLLRQRTRWIQGHYQCWSHIPKLARAKGASYAGRFDLVTYLFLVVTVVVISLSMTAVLASGLGLVHLTSSFLSFVPDGLGLRVTSLVLSILPLAIFMLTYQMNSRHPYRWWEVPTFALIFSAYSYVWIVTTLRAWTRMLLRRNGWVKTPRVGPTPSLPPTIGLQAGR
ncbi:glycosyltransferase family 2 protein [uncultured Jatrophihabitans sp.]|uniref:glycosyltransferase family 2 protein n=1 Tax=uncultured Jatrophihabitans sp. TaxID=1610747 RepID=UPI0035CA2ED8